MGVTHALSPRNSDSDIAGGPLHFQIETLYFSLSGEDLLKMRRVSLALKSQQRWKLERKIVLDYYNGLGRRKHCLTSLLHVSNDFC